MGTFYTIGIINKFDARATKGTSRHYQFRDHLPLSETEWKEALGKRIDTAIFKLEMQEDGTIKGFLNNDVFNQNIKGFYDVLREILGEGRNGNFDYYEKNMIRNGELQEINDNDEYYDTGYPFEWAHPLRILNKDGVEIQINCQFIMLFIEGKVLVEEFFTDPVMINYLFRHSNINNPLKGAVISQVVG